MKKIILLFSVAFNYAIAQSPYPIKEHYDHLYDTYSQPNFDYTNCDKRANSLGWTLSGLLRMYQTTGDKAYLVKIINHCIKLQQVRWDQVYSGEAPVWIRRPVNGNCNNPTVQDDACDGKSDNKEAAYFNSLIIYPMAEFINTVIQNPTLYNTSLPSVIDMNTLQQLPNYGISITDYGHFAWWLGYRVEQTLAYMNSTYWNDSYSISSHYCDPFGASMNQISPYGCALLYMGLTNTNFGYDANRVYYITKAKLIAGLYKAYISLSDHCQSQVTSYNGYELQVDANNSYIWFTNAMSHKKHNCTLYTNQDDIDTYVSNLEDPGHGAMDLWFPLACYTAQLALNPGDTPYFTSVEMTRFRNTFTKNIYYTNGTGGHFHNNVNGTDNPCQADCSPNCPTDLNYGEAIDWMPVYKFDGGSTPNAYDILLQHTTGLISTPSTQGLTGAESYLGLAEVVKAQWDKASPNLNLFNRDVVYSQDFNAKGYIVVAPQQDFTISGINYYTAGVTDPFAEPKTFTGGGSKNRFVVETGTTVNMVAGVSVELNAGFEVGLGAGFTGNVQ